MPVLETPQTDSVRGPLALGSRGNDVQTVQASLNNQVQPNPRLVTDGGFGAKTDAAVRLTQQQKGLKVDGIVGPLTARALGLKFSFLPPPKPLPRLPGESLLLPLSGKSVPPQATLTAAIVAGLRNILRAVDLEIQVQETQVNLPVPFFGIARADALNGFNQALFLLNIAAAAKVDANFTGAQIRMALFTMFGGLTRASADIQAAPGASGATILGIGSKLAGVTEAVVSTVQRTLEGNSGLTVEAASQQVSILLNTVAG